MSLLLHASSLHPNLPIFPASLTQEPDPSAPVPVFESLTPNAPSVQATAPAQQPPPPPVIQAKENELSESEDYEDEELPYPKAGNGVRLLPEIEDIDWLLDDAMCSTFSHRIRGVRVDVLGRSVAAAA